MIQVFTDDALEFRGGVMDVGRFIGISRPTLYKLLSGEADFLPKHAKCDYIVSNGVAYHKKDERYYENLPTNTKEFEIGFKLIVNSITYEITSIDKKGDYYYYTYNNEVIVRARKKYNNYYTLRQGLGRALS